MLVLLVLLLLVVVLLLLRRRHAAALLYSSRSGSVLIIEVTRMLLLMLLLMLRGVSVMKHGAGRGGNTWVGKSADAVVASPAEAAALVIGNRKRIGGGGNHRPILGYISRVAAATLVETHVVVSIHDTAAKSARV